MKKLNIAVIGQGRSGRDIHGAYLLTDKAKEKYNVVAIVDKMETRRVRALREFGCDVYDDYTKLFDRDDIDVVVNSTFSYLHYPITKDLLLHGFNVVTEKPFATHGSECEDMIKTAKEAGKIVTVFHQSRLAPYYRRIREIMDSGILGDILQISLSFSGYARRWDWQSTNRYGGGGVYNTGPHPIDQAVDLLGTDVMPQIVYSRLAKVNTFGDADDYAKILLTAPGKPLVDVEISSCNAYADYTYKIHGSRGSLKATLAETDYKYFDPAEAPEQKLILEPLTKDNDGVTPSYCVETLPWKTVHEKFEGSPFDTAVELYYDKLYDSIVSGAPLFLPPERALQVIRVAEAVHAANPMETIY